MKFFICRDLGRTEHDDFVLNVQPHIGPWSEALRVQQSDADGWMIIGRFE